MKFLIVKLSALGDIVQAFPTVEYLKKRFKNCHISWVVDKRCASLVKSHPSIDKTIIIDLKALKKQPVSLNSLSYLKEIKKEIHEIVYDCVFDLQGNIKSGFLTYLAKANEKAGFSWESLAEWPSGLATTTKVKVPKKLNAKLSYLELLKGYFQDKEPFEEGVLKLKLSDDEEKKLKALVDQLFSSGKKIIFVCVGSAWPNKKLPESSLTYLINTLSEQCKNCLFVFGPGNDEEFEESYRISKQISQETFVLEKLSIPLFQHCLLRSSGVIAMDSFALHLAGASKKPTFGFFGPSLGEIYAPPINDSAYFQGECPYGITFVKRCPKLRTCKTGACLREVPKAILLKSLQKTHWISENFKP